MLWASSEITISPVVSNSLATNLSTFFGVKDMISATLLLSKAHAGSKTLSGFCNAWLVLIYLM